MLTSRIEIGSIEKVLSGHVQVRTDTVVERDGVEISRTYHRHVIAPGDDLTNEDADVRAVCEALHTPEVVAAYKAKTPSVE
jgi:hypothetical protein